MLWLNQLREAATSYWRLAQSVQNPALRDKWLGKAAECEEMAIICDTAEAERVCPLAAGHPLRAQCRRAQTGSCAKHALIADHDRP